MAVPKEFFSYLIVLFKSEMCVPYRSLKLLLLSSQGKCILVRDSAYKM